MAQAAAEQPKKPGWRRILAALGNRKTGYMAIFGFAAGLPYALLLGTLYAWLSDAEVDLETMGVFSLIGLAYAFKFLWSPLLDRVNIPIVCKLGLRKQWIVTAQLSLGVILLVLSTLNPVSALGVFSLLAGIGAFASATQDVVVDAWRVDVADETATIDMLSTVYQMGYRMAALVGGALALFLAERTSWPVVYATMGAIMTLIGIVSLFAPDAEYAAARIGAGEDDLAQLRKAGEIEPGIRKYSLLAIGAMWAWALITVGVFMVRSLGSDPDARPDSVAFITTRGPLIVMATVIVPAMIAAFLVYLKQRGRYILTEDVAVSTGFDRFVDHGYRALILPLAEFVGRLGWAVIIVLGLVLTYRITDSIWGSFAYPFYLGELEYTKDEVAVASKFFGVGALMLGLAVGGTLLTLIGRMATLTLGAVIAALTNLLYADLAIGGARMQMVSDAIGFSWLVTNLGGDPRLARLMMTIAGENIAVGIAGAAFVAYLSSIVSKGYSAVQYALVSSLTLLIGTLGRGALGKMIEDQGYYQVFLLTTAIGFFAVALCLLEWWRITRQGRKSGVDELALKNA